MKPILAIVLIAIFLSGCGKSKVEIQNEELLEKIALVESKLEDAQSSIQSAKSNIEDLQDKIRSGSFYGILSDLEDIADELDSADSEVDDAIGELR